MQAVRRFMLEFIEIVFFFMQTHEKETQLNLIFYVFHIDFRR